jgi:NAD-dependent deacetylase
MTEGLDLAPLRPFYRRLKGGGLLAIVTGSGVAAESGLTAPDGPAAPEGGGSERMEDPEGSRPEGFSPEGVSAESFAGAPERVWRQVEERRGEVAAARPSGAHRAIAELQRLLPRVRVVTLNVDGLHQAAGSREVIELNGSLLRSRCTVEGKVFPAPARLESLPPSCPECGGLLRPDVVWRGEPYPVEAWRAAEEAAGGCSLLLVVGTSSVAAPASLLSLLAARAGAGIFELDAEENALAPLADGVLRGKPSEALALLVREVAAR